MIVHLRDDEGTHRQFDLQAGNWTVLPALIAEGNVYVMIELTPEDDRVQIPLMSVTEALANAKAALDVAEIRSDEGKSARTWTEIGKGWAALAAVLAQIESRSSS